VLLTEGDYGWRVCRSYRIILTAAGRWKASLVGVGRRNHRVNLSGGDHQVVAVSVGLLRGGEQHLLLGVMLPQQMLSEERRGRVPVVGETVVAAAGGGGVAEGLIMLLWLILLLWSILVLWLTLLLW